MTLYIRFPLSLTNVEDLMHERGVDVSHDAVRFWSHHFGPMFASEIRKRRIEGMPSSRWRWHLDEVFVKIAGERHYLWRAVDHEGEVLKAFVTKKRDREAVFKLVRTLMKRHGRVQVVVTERLRSCGGAFGDRGVAARQETGGWTDNRAINSYQLFRRQKRAMQLFRRMRSLQKFAAVHSSVHNHLNSDRGLTTRPFSEANRAALADRRGLGAT